MVARSYNIKNIGTLILQRDYQERKYVLTLKNNTQDPCEIQEGVPKLDDQLEWIKTTTQNCLKLAEWLALSWMLGFNQLRDNFLGGLTIQLSHFPDTQLNISNCQTLSSLSPHHRLTIMIYVYIFETQYRVYILHLLLWKYKFNKKCMKADNWYYW